MLRVNHAMRRLLMTQMSALFALTVNGNAQERLPTIPPAKYSRAQQQAAADFLAAGLKRSYCCPARKRAPLTACLCAHGLAVGA